MKCEVCEEDFVHSERKEDLCPECDAALREGCAEVLLLPDECALVMRNDSTPQLFFTAREDIDAPISKNEMVLGALAFAMSNEELLIQILDNFHKGMADMEKGK